jgi:hypothetical protein
MGNPVIRSHILLNEHFDNWQTEIEGKWSYRQLYNDERWRKGWISFDAITWSVEEEALYCGLNAMDGDLLYRFHPDEERFESLEARQWTDKFDSKVHRCLLRNPDDGCFYFGTSLLHDIDQQHEAPGGKLMRYDPKSGKFTLLAIPFPHLYIQSIAADFERGKIYCFTYPAEFVVCYDMESGTCRNLGYITNATSLVQPHNGVVDAAGYLWGTCAETRAFDEVAGQTPVRLFRYHPDTDHFDWFEFGLSRRDDKPQQVPDPVQEREITFHRDQTRHKEDLGFCDAMVYDGERYIYAGTTAGILCRIDTHALKVEKVAHVIPAGRLPALAIDAKGVLYGAGGIKGDTQLFKWRPGGDNIVLLNRIEDEQRNRPARIHDIAIGGDGIIFLAENDNHKRSSYLWTINGF